MSEHKWADLFGIDPTFTEGDHEAARCTAALNIAGEHYPCQLEYEHSKVHNNSDARAIWSCSTPEQHIQEGPVDAWSKYKALRDSAREELEEEPPEGVQQVSEPDCPSVPCGYRFATWSESHACGLSRNHEGNHRCACGDEDRQIVGVEILLPETQP